MQPRHDASSGTHPEQRVQRLRDPPEQLVHRLLLGLSLGSCFRFHVAAKNAAQYNIYTAIKQQ
jgi:hypothetical protein